ncbi:MAG: carboxypeptidase-like regulatory domain-containing protein [Mariprofundaceae bacterium]
MQILFATYDVLLNFLLNFVYVIYFLNLNHFLMPLTTNRPLAHYTCAQPELYAACEIGWQNYADNLAAFTAFSPLYDAAFGTTALAAVAAAQAIPDFQARSESTETGHVFLIQSADAAILKWKAMRQYIKKTFPPEVFKAKLEAAGYLYYPLATNRNWEHLKNMMQSGDAFITANSVDMLAAGMPVAFQADYQAAMATFLANYAQFTNAYENIAQGTDAKLIANNKCYDDLIAMFEDAVLIFAKDAAKRELFIFTRVMDVVTNQLHPNQAPATFSGTITNSFDLAPLAGVTVTISELALQTISDAAGQFSIDNFAPGSYTVLFLKAGFTQRTMIDYIILEGQNNLDLALDPQS